MTSTDWTIRLRERCLGWTGGVRSRVEEDAKVGWDERRSIEAILVVSVSIRTGAGAIEGSESTEGAKDEHTICSLGSADDWVGAEALEGISSGSVGSRDPPPHPTQG